MSGKPGALVVGSLHYDIFVEAPHRPAAGETVSGISWRPKLGGKGGNQAIAAARAGCPCLLVSAVGRDSFGDFLLKNLVTCGVDGTHVAQIDGIGSGMSVAITDASGDYGAVIVSGSNLRIDPAALDDEAVWAGTGLLVLQNEITASTNIKAAQNARARGIEVLLNAAPADAIPDELLALVDILVVNAGEAETLSGVTVRNLADAAEAAAALACRVPIALVTAGGDGVAVSGGAEIFSLPGHIVDLVSTHGAGDCFIGALTAARLSGASLREATATANFAAARHVSGIRKLELTALQR